MRSILCGVLVFVTFCPAVVYSFLRMLGGIGEGQPPNFQQQLFSELLVLWLVLPIVMGLVVTVLGLATRPWWRAPLLGMAPVFALGVLFGPLLGFMAIPAGAMLLGQWVPARVLRGEPLFEPMGRESSGSA